MKKLIPIAVMLAVVVCCFAVFTTADETDEGLVAYYELSADLTDSVGDADGEIVYHNITTTDADVSAYTAAFADGSLVIESASEYGIKLPVTGIEDEFTIVVTLSIDSETSGSWWSPLLFVGSTDQETQNYIAVIPGDHLDLRVNPNWLQVDGNVYTLPSDEVTVTIVYDNGTVYYYVDGVYMGSCTDELNPWDTDGCAIYLAANAWGDTNTAASYSDLYVYSYALTTPEVERITETPTDNDLPTSYYAAYVDDGNGSWGGNEATTADKAWDGDISTFYDSANGSDVYTGVQLTEATALSYVGIYPRDGYSFRLRFAEIQGSTDGETWVTLYTIGTDEYAEGEWTYYAITDETAYTYYRLLTPNTNCNPAEIKLYSSSYGALLSSYTFDSDLTDSVGSADGSLVYRNITTTDADEADVSKYTAAFENGALTIAEGSAFGVKLPVTGINGDFTVVVTISIDEDSPEWWGPVVWIGGTEQDSQNFIGLFARGSMVLQSNDPDWHYYSIDGVAFTCPTDEVTYMIVYEDDTVYYYIDGVYMGSQDGMTNPWSEDDCAIYLAANAWGDPNTAASYSELSVYSYALTTPEVERITETPTDSEISSSCYAAYVDDGYGSWGGDEATTADKAWDGDISTFYDSANGSDVYTGVQLTEATALSYVGIYPRDGYSYRLRFAEIQGSTDGETWVTLYTIGADEYAEGEWTYYAITDETAYTYYRLLTPNTNCNPAEIVLYSAPVASDEPAETDEPTETNSTVTGTADDVVITEFAGASTGTLSFTKDFSLTYSFTNTSTGSNNWDNFIVEVYNADGVYVTVRADNYGWLANQTDTTDTITFGDGLDEDGWTAWKAAMAAGSECTVTVVKSGTTVTITCNCGGATFTATATVSEFEDAELTVHLTGENVNLSNVSYSYTLASTSTVVPTSPQTGFAVVGLAVVAVISGAALTVSKRRF